MKISKCLFDIVKQNKTKQQSTKKEKREEMSSVSEKRQRVNSLAIRATSVHFWKTLAHCFLGARIDYIFYHSSAICDNNGTPNGPICSCPSGFTGSYCEETGKLLLYSFVSSGTFLCKALTLTLVL